jgi:GNAT superfamily N-acetyltransferase
MKKGDCSVIAAAFKTQGWNKPLSQYRSYWEESLAGKRVVLVAEYETQFAGYVTIVWESHYPPFCKAHIPEIVDFNVLLKYRRLKVGTALMDGAEERVAQHSPVVGIGVGMDADYGAAQVLYVKRGYVPDGCGLFYRGRHPSYGEQVKVGDDLTLYFTKDLQAG